MLNNTKEKRARKESDIKTNLQKTYVATNVQATNNYFHNPSIDHFEMNCFIYKNIRKWEKCPLEVPRVQGNVFTLLVLTDQQSKHPQENQF